MKSIKNGLARFFFPPTDAARWVRLLPYIVLGVLTLLLLTGGAYAWDYTNSPGFCGTTCHTMPPEFSAYLASPHARIDCVDCHIGKGFIATRISRKAGDVRHVIATTFHTYEYPIRALELRPARETCERCHFPEKFSDDKFKQIVSYQDDKANTAISTYLTLKTGGGSKKVGLGKGIHWHIVNKVFYLSTDPEEQVIPYVRIVDDSGKVTEYKSTDATIDPAQLNSNNLKEMDCITCHNRITHLVDTPDNTVNALITRGQISRQIPEIHKKAVEMYSKPSTTVVEGLQNIASLSAYYQQNYADFYSSNKDQVDQAISALQEAYRNNVYPEQKSDWTTHPNNVGHKNFPGCFRCHDGKHLDTNDEAIPLECNLCHSIPVVAGPKELVVPIEINRGPEPKTHLNTNWITLHRDAFNPTCSGCHTIDDPGGVSNTSFCSNSACHGNVWKYAGYNAPGLREKLIKQLPPTPTPTLTPTPTPTPTETPTPEPGVTEEAVTPTPTAGESAQGPLTWDATIGPILTKRCSDCHSDEPMLNLNLMSYNNAMKGGDDGAVIIPGDPDKSLIVQKQSAAKAHYGQLDPDELKLLIAWIKAGAPEK